MALTADKIAGPFGLDSWQYMTSHVLCLHRWRQRDNTTLLMSNSIKLCPLMHPLSCRRAAVSSTTTETCRSTWPSIDGNTAQFLHSMLHAAGEHMKFNLSLHTLELCGVMGGNTPMRERRMSIWLFAHAKAGRLIMTLFRYLGEILLSLPR